MKAFIDTIPKTVAHAGAVIAEGTVYVATNGMVVTLSKDRTVLTIVKGQKILKRAFETPISKQWLVRRIEGFADEMKAQKLPRGPRPASKSEKKRIKVQAANRVTKKKRVNRAAAEFA